jgi:hypothetical protein
MTRISLVYNCPDFFKKNTMSNISSRRKYFVQYALDSKLMIICFLLKNTLAMTLKKIFLLTFNYIFFN